MRVRDWFFSTLYLLDTRSCLVYTFFYVYFNTFGKHLFRKSEEFLYFLEEIYEEGQDVKFL